MRKNILLCLLFLVTITLLTGCGAHGRLYGKSKVLDYVRKEVPQEEYTFEGAEKVPGADVSTEIYTFRSKERDLEFVVKNTRASVIMDSALYGRTIIPQYVEAVHELYRDDAVSLLSSSGLRIDGKRIYIETYEDLVSLAVYFTAADDIYKEELDYNSEEWLMDNPLEKYNLFKIRQNDDGTDDVKVNFGGIAINGTWDTEKLLDYVSFCYVSAIKEGRLEDTNIPDRYSDVAHISTIHNIYLNGVNISETAHTAAKKKKLNNNSDGMYTSGYCYKLEDYVIPLNVGLTDEKYAPQMIEEIFDTLDIDYNIKYGKGAVSWKSGDEKWEIRASEKDNDIQSFVIRKNGKVMDIPYITCGEWTSPISGTYIVGIRAKDFASIFNLEMQVDELGDCIRFERK